MNYYDPRFAGPDSDAKPLSLEQENAALRAQITSLFKMMAIITLTRQPQDIGKTGRAGSELETAVVEVAKEAISALLFAEYDQSPWEAERIAKRVSREIASTVLGRLE